MASEPTTTPPYIKVTMASVPTATPSDATPTTIPNVRTTPRDQASFASLPREIRDKIYRLALPYWGEIKLRSGPRPLRHGFQGILSPLASTSMYANEACEMLLKSNKIRVGVQHLQMMLGEDGTSFQCHFHATFQRVVFINRIDIKSWLRGVVIDIELWDNTHELAGRVSLLLECPALQWVNVVLGKGWGSYRLRREKGRVSCAFKALAEKLGRRLTFNIFAIIRNIWSERRFESFIGDLEKLETVVGDENSDDENEG